MRLRRIREDIVPPLEKGIHSFEVMSGIGHALCQLLAAQQFNVSNGSNRLTFVQCFVTIETFHYRALSGSATNGRREYRHPLRGRAARDIGCSRPVEEHLEKVRIKLAGRRAHDFGGGRVSEPGAIWARRRQRVVDIGDAEYSGGERYLLSGEPVRDRDQR